MHSLLRSCDIEIGLNCLHEKQYQNILEYRIQTSSNLTIFRYDI